MVGAAAPALSECWRYEIFITLIHVKKFNLINGGTQ